MAAWVGMPSIRNSTCMSVDSGFQWMSEAPRSTAWAMIEWTSLTAGRVLAQVGERDLRLGLLDLANVSRRAGSRRVISGGDVGLRGSRPRDLHAGDHHHLVDGDDVRGVGHRQHQRPVGEEADRHRLQALGQLDRDQVGRPHVNFVRRQVDVVDAEPLAERPRQLVLTHLARLDQDLAGRLAAVARRATASVDRLARREA